MATWCFTPSQWTKTPTAQSPSPNKDSLKKVEKRSTWPTCIKTGSKFCGSQTQAWTPAQMLPKHDVLPGTLHTLTSTHTHPMTFIHTHQWHPPIHTLWHPPICTLWHPPIHTQWHPFRHTQWHPSICTQWHPSIRTSNIHPYAPYDIHPTPTDQSAMQPVQTPVTHCGQDPRKDAASRLPELGVSCTEPCCPETPPVSVTTYAPSAEPGGWPLGPHPCFETCL